MIEMNASLVPMFQRELELCKVTAGERIGIITQNRVRAAYADAFATAARSLGAKPFHVDMQAPRVGPPMEVAGPLSVNALADNELVAEMLKRCGMVIDLIFLLWSKQQHEILDAGSRILTCVDPPDVLERLFPTEEVATRVKADAELLRRARTMRIFNDRGTDVTYELGQYRVNHQVGFSDAPGRWDLFASALAATYGNDGGVEGTIALGPGDLILPFRRYVTTEVKFTIRRGRITAIDGGADAKIIRDYMEWFDDDRAYGMSHAGWSQHPEGRWEVHWLGSDGIGMDGRSLAGGVMISTGPNVEGGGDNDTFAHLDIPMRDCSVALDGQLIVDAGRLLDVGVADRITTT
ncbi:MAG: leucyl aminopeptidase [Actinobacteria bacterium]|nr:leucyl aminopeptidase [Actinomycetota bacterium]